jgi:ribonucleotide reductase beta subunit family protein with ferritin-like domain
MDEPLLQENENRFVMFPIKYNDVWTMYKKQLDSFWRVEEVNVFKDLFDWKKLKENEKMFIKLVLGFFAASDGIVTENLAQRFMNDIQVPEVRAFYGMQIFIENIHSEMYATLIDTYITENEEKTRLFQSIRNYECIQRKAQWAQKWISSQDATFAMRLVAFAIVEGIFFSASFCSIYWLKKRGIMPGLTLSNDFISRDEALHVEFAVLLYSKLVNRLQPELFQEIMKEAVDAEKQFVMEALPVKLIGMNADLMCQYVEFVSNRLCLQLGYEKIYENASNPFDFMEMISLENKVNFFEKTNTVYALSTKTIEGDPFNTDTFF